MTAVLTLIFIKKIYWKLYFAEWSMKYSPHKEEINRLLLANGYKSLNPLNILVRLSLTISIIALSFGLASIVKAV